MKYGKILNVCTNMYPVANKQKENLEWKIEYIEGENFPKGFVLREDEKGVVLEKHFDDKSLNIDVLMRFEGAQLMVEQNFHQCFSEVRKLIKDSVPIYVKL